MAKKKSAPQTEASGLGMVGGVAAGAAAGSMFGPVGAAIGALVGGAAGANVNAIASSIPHSVKTAASKGTKKVAAMAQPKAHQSGSKRKTATRRVSTRKK